VGFLCRSFERFVLHWAEVMNRHVVMKGSTQTTIRAHINIFLGSVALLFAATATAGVILKIDIANPDVIEFIATEVSSEIDNNTYVYAEGVTLLGFFGTSALGIEAGMSGTLAVPLEGFDLYYDGIFSDSIDLELFVVVDEDGDPATVEIQEFTQSSRAFSGTSTLTGFDSIDRMRGVGSTGDIVAGYAKSDNGVSKPIGQWEIIDSSNTAVDPALIWLLLRPQVLDEE
jgi:hypothetical protein